jgi:hypothetical protein
VTLSFALALLGAVVVPGQENEQQADQAAGEQAEEDSAREADAEAQDDAATDDGSGVDVEAQLPGGVDGAVKLLNVGNSEWRIVDVAGDGARSGLGGAVMRLQIGGRYHIDLRSVDSSLLPLDVRSLSGRVLMSQRDGVGTMEIDGVDPEVTADGITFTFTQELAGRVASYRAAPYPAMVGFISAIPSEEDAGEAGNQQEAGNEPEAGNQQETDEAAGGP